MPGDNMYYVCIENDIICSILSYEPTVPSNIKVVKISDSDEELLRKKTHYFDIFTNAVIPVSAETLKQNEQKEINKKDRLFLNSTDWKVLRHIRQKALNEVTSLSDDEYLNLERQRQAAALRIST